MFPQLWSEPDGGLHKYLTRFFSSDDPTFQHIAVWTLLQLLESNDRTLLGLIQNSNDIFEMVKAIAHRPTPVSSDDEGAYEHFAGEEDGDIQDVTSLAKQCLDIIEVGDSSSSHS